MSRLLIRLLVLLALPALLAFLTYRGLRYAVIQPLDPSKTETTLFEIANGTPVRQVCRDLQSKGYVRYWMAVELVARVYRDKQTGERKGIKNIKAGEYELSASMSPRTIIEKLYNGEVFKRRVTVREGMSVWEIGKQLEQAGVVTEAEFNRAAVDPALLSRFPDIEGKSFEGFLFPETYFFSKPITAERVVVRMIEEGESVKNWPPEFSTRAEELKMRRFEIITLASMIEKESGNAEEQPMISSVFYNRLAKGMKLESDPTVIYGIANFDGNLTREHLHTPHPYNTYTQPGLPVGPICNPGASAIRAALYPTSSEYYFFVGNGLGSHVFSATLQEHNEAVVKYQLNRAKPDATPTPSPTP